jgi:hypothetical protein
VVVVVVVLVVVGGADSATADPPTSTALGTRSCSREGDSRARLQLVWERGDVQLNIVQLNNSVGISVTGVWGTPHVARFFAAFVSGRVGRHSAQISGVITRDEEMGSPSS